MPTATKPTTPPLDTGELDRAHAMLKRFRKQLEPMPPEWRDWIIDSLAATFETDEEVPA